MDLQKTFAYHRRDDGIYVLMNGTEEVLRTSTPVIALAIDAELGVLHKHGSIEQVEQWAARFRKALSAAGSESDANALVVVSGELPVDEVNHCLAVFDYAGRMLQKCIDQARATSAVSEGIEDESPSMSPN